jgi:hypothetical protein
MKLIPEDRQLYLSGRIWEEVQPKFNLVPFIYALHDAIDLAKYGNGIRKFYFTFIIVPADDLINRPAKQYFHAKKREAEISVEIPWLIFKNATETEAIKLMETAYLNGIELIKTLPLKERFDVGEFRRDVERIFGREEWYKRPLTALDM